MPGAASIRNVPLIYPDTFFSLPHPDSPWVSVQFRNSVKGDITDPTQWDEITLNPSNYFDNIKIEDESGFQRVNLNLVDQTFTNLETFITKAILAVNYANKLTQSNVTQETKEQFFQFTTDTKTTVNLRVRFGYGNIDTDKTIIDDTTFNGPYAQRTSQKQSVIRSPWIYLQILNVTFKLTEYGLAASITAISTFENWLTRAKMLRRFYIFRDEPLNMIGWLTKSIKDLSNSSVTVQIQDSPDKVVNTGEPPSHTIEINLGDEIDEKSKANFRSVKSFIDEMVSKIPTRVYDSSLQPIKNDEDQQSNAGEKVSFTCKYSYNLTPTKRKGDYNLNFFYPDPLANPQALMRTYVWREYGKSIVKSFEVDSRTDFAALNYPIAVMNKTYKTTDPSIFVAPSTNGDIDPRFRLVTPTDVSAALKNMDISFVSDVMNTSGQQQNLNALITQGVVHFLNQGVFDGTLTLPGDPFFLFDNKVRPFEYMIKMVIIRPAYFTKEGQYKDTTQTQFSYLSGFYLLKKITHDIGANGFTTTLEVTRFPLGGETNA